MRHDAIYALYSTVVSIAGDTAYDASGNEVTIDETSVSTKQTELENADNLGKLRVERNKKLAETDHWMFSDTATATQAQLDYRQALRDITETYSSLDDVIWPVKP